MRLKLWPKFRITPHVVRHSGPSEDVLEEKLSIPEVKKRGRWLTDAAARRYEKSGRLLLTAARLPPGIQARKDEACTEAVALLLKHINR